MVDPTNGQFTLQYITVIGAMARYLLFISAMVYECAFSISHSTEISESLRELELQAYKHRECVRSYPYAICVIFAVMVIDVFSLYVLDKVVKSIADGAFMMEAIYIFLVEALASSASALVAIEPTIDISRPSTVLPLGMTDDFILIFLTVYIPILLKIRPFDQAILLAGLLKIFANASSFISLDIENIAMPNKSSVFLHWRHFSEDFTKQALELFSKVNFDKNNCRVKFSLRKYIDFGHKFIEIPSEALHYYGEDALIGYIAFVLAQIENETIMTVTGAVILSKVVVFLVLSRLIYKSLTLGNPLIEVIRAIRMARTLEFFLDLLVNVLSRRLELICDKFAIEQGLRSNLLEYIRKTDQDPKIGFSSHFTKLMAIFSPKNCLKDRIHAASQPE